MRNRITSGEPLIIALLNSSSVYHQMKYVLDFFSKEILIDIRSSAKRNGALLDLFILIIRYFISLAAQSDKNRVSPMGNNCSKNKISKKQHKDDLAPYATKEVSQFIYLSNRNCDRAKKVTGICMLLQRSMTTPFKASPASLP